MYAYENIYIHVYLWKMGEKEARPKTATEGKMMV